MQPWATVPLLALLALVPSLAGAQSDGSIFVPLPRFGDEVVYDLVHANGTAEPYGAFAWDGAVATADAWGRPLEADLLRRYDLQPHPETGALTWTESREAYAGAPGDPVWRTMRYNASSESRQGLAGLPLPVAESSFGFALNTSVVSYTHGTWPADCRVRHALQGARLRPGDVVPLERVCFGILGGLGEPLPAVAARYGDRPAVALRFRVPGGESGDVSWPEATAYLVYAEGIPYPVEMRYEPAAYATQGERLSSLTLGAGPQVRPRAEALPAPAMRPGATLGPVMPDGPADGSPALPYPLRDAVADLEADPGLGEYRAWRRSHSDAVLVVANLNLDDAAPWSTATWVLTWAEGAESYTAVTTRTLEAQVGGLPMDLRGLPAQPQRWGNGVAPWDRAPRLDQLPSALLDLASVLAAWDAHAPPALKGRPATWLTYSVGWEDDRPVPVYEVGVRDGQERLDAARGETRSASNSTSVVLDASTGAAQQVVEGQVVTTHAVLPLRPPRLAGGSEGAAVQVAPAGALPGEAVLLSVAAAAVGLALLGKGALFGLYARLRGLDILRHPVRRQLYDAIRADPGVHLGALVLRAGRRNGVVLHHLRALEREGLVRSARTGGFRRYFAAGTSLPHQAVGALRAGSGRAVYDAVRARPGITQAEVAALLGLSRPAVHRTVDQLAGAGLLDRERRGREVGLRAREP